MIYHTVVRTMYIHTIKDENTYIHSIKLALDNKELSGVSSI